PAHPRHRPVRRRRAQPAGGDRGRPGDRRGRAHRRRGQRTRPSRTCRHAQAREAQRPQARKRRLRRLMGTLFIADLHLDDSRPQITTLFERYLASDEVRRADALYILGDLVEAWIGDDDDAELPRRIAAATRAVREADGPVYFMGGSRDFLLGEDYARRAGFELLVDGTVHTLHGHPTLLMHGDVLCTDDTAYQTVRRQVRTPEWKAQILAMPLEARRAFAAKSRAESRAHTGSTMEA